MTGMNETAKEMARLLYDFCAFYFEDNSLDYDEEKSLSVEKLVECASYAQRDLLRIGVDLKDRVSRQKFAAYHAFWFAKMSPVAQVYQKNESSTEIVDINERLATEIAFWFVSNSTIILDKDIRTLSEEEALKTTGFQEEPVPLIWEKCDLDCTGQCFKRHAVSFLSMHDWQNFEYIVHSLRHRASGPYDLVNILESCVTLSCKAIHDETHPLLN